MRNSPRWLSAILPLVALFSARAQERLPDLVRRLEPSVVTIVGTSADLGKESQGTGFFVGSNLIVTNSHVVENTAGSKIRVSNGREYDVIAVLATDPVHDLAVLRVATSGTPLMTTGFKPVESGCG